MRRNWQPPWLSSVSFNSRTLGRVRLGNAGAFLGAGAFQFTHPGKGATVSAFRSVKSDGVSIHAPWEGCDATLQHGLTLLHGFNSRTLGRVRRYLRGCDYRTHRVSIHAPWEGCDACRWSSPCLWLLFQFTHPGKGATHWPSFVAPYCESFNSRTLGRVRQEDYRNYSINFWFQFTHPGKGATGRRNEADIASTVSIHAPWEGCDRHPGRKLLTCAVSIHAPWEGCDLPLPLVLMLPMSFNSRTLGRVRRLLDMLGYGFRFVSIHAPWEGCDPR